MGGDVSKAKAESAEYRRKRLRQIVHQGTALLAPFSIDGTLIFVIGFIFKTVDEVLEWLELIEAPESVSKIVKEYQIDGEGLLTVSPDFLLGTRDDRFMQELAGIRKDWEKQQASMMEIHFEGRKKELANAEGQVAVDPDFDDDESNEVSKEEEEEKQKDDVRRKKLLEAGGEVGVDDFFPAHKIPKEGGGEAIVRYYHDVTKHEARAGSRGLKADWALQPSPYRRYYTSPYTPLHPKQQPTTTTTTKNKSNNKTKETGKDTIKTCFPFHTLFDEDAYDADVSASPLDINSLHDFLHHSLALSAMKQTLGNSWTLRVPPSRYLSLSLSLSLFPLTKFSGGLHPTESYVILPHLEGLSGSKAGGGGVCHYSPKEHGLELRSAIEKESWEAMTAGTPAGSFFIALTSVIWYPYPFLSSPQPPHPQPSNTLSRCITSQRREVWKYGERGWRYLANYFIFLNTEYLLKKQIS